MSLIEIKNFDGINLSTEILTNKDDTTIVGLKKKENNNIHSWSYLTILFMACINLVERKNAESKKCRKKKYRKYY